MNAPAQTATATAVHKGLYAALAAAQAEMGPALKDSVNPAFKSKYADLASVMAACLPALNAHGIAVIQPPYQDETGQRFVKTVFVHGETGETAECAVSLIVAKNDMQGYGSAVTYARRYGLMSMAGIAPEDDDGNAAAKAPPRQSDMVERTHETPAQSLATAFNDAVLDSLPVDASPRQKAEAFAAAIIADFSGKGMKAMENAWGKHERMIGSMEQKHPDLHERIVDAYENRMIELQQKEAAQ